MRKKIISIENCLESNQLPDHDLLFSLCDKVCSVLETEDSDYRPLDKFGDSGSLIELTKNIPVIIVPDIHGRPDFIKNILDFKLTKEWGVKSSKTVLQALENGEVYLVCVGDAMHTEKTKERWQKIQKEADSGNIYCQEMKEEMISNLSVLSALMELKIEYPNYFHFIKGNHENVLNVTEDGDFSFMKYADEGELCRFFLAGYYGDDILYLIHYFEKSLPLVAFSKYANCVISHAEPAKFYLKGEIINGHLYPEVIAGLTWTKNDDVSENTALFLMKNLLNPETVKDAFYFGGHRPVKENYALRQNGQYIQLHNPSMQNIAIVKPGEIFNPQNHIVAVN